MKTLVITVVFGIVTLAPCSFSQTPKPEESESRQKVTRAQAIKVVRPIYPDLAKQSRIEGRVSLKCVIGTDGTVKRAEPKEGPPMLIQAATDAVMQWKFKPLVVNGQPTEMETTISIDFQLPNERRPAESKRHQPD